jgi:type VI secretion system protein ImpL
VPWGTGWLFAGSEFGDAARQAYAREVDDALLDRLVALFRHGMTDTSRPPSTQYGYLKGYLMLRSQEHLDVQYLTNLARREWRSAYSATPAAGDKLAEHFTRLLEYQPAGFRAPTVEQGDEALVREVRTRLQAAPLEDLIYSEIQTKYSGTEQGQSLAMLSEKVIVRKRGGRFPAAMAALYTKPIFKTVVDQDIDRLKQQFRDDYDWVWGTDRAERTFPADLEQLVVKLYEKDYIRAWNEVVDDIGLEPLTSSNVTREALVVLAGKAGKGSVLRRFLETLDQHTFLVEAAAPKTEGVLDAWRARAGAMLESLRSALKSHPPAPGLQVTEYFLPVHALLAGDAGKAPIDGLLAQLSEMAAQLEKVGGGVGQAPPTDNDLRSLGRTAEELKRDSTDLQGPANVVGGLVSDIAKSASDAVRKDAGNTLGDTFRTEVLGRCMNSINGRYPFVDATEDVRLADFADLFGTGGAYDTFFATHLKNLADTSGGSWVYRDGAPTGLPPLRQFQQAQRIREMFFGRGSRTPEVNFSISFAELTNATAVRVEIDGSTPAPRYAHDGDRSWKLKWPGDKPGAVVTFEQRGKPAQYLEARGDWALFRLLAMGPRKNQSGERFDVELVKDQARVVLRIDGMQVNSAFTGFNELRAFRCGG